MKKTHLTLATLLAFAAQSALAQELKTDEQKLGYALGLDMVSNLQEMGVVSAIDKEALLLGLKDGLEEGKKPALSEEEIEKVFEKFMEKRSAELEAQMKAEEAARQKAGEEQLKLGKEFLEKNKSAEGVKTTASGLQYKVQKEGNGAKPSLDDEVEVKYKGTLISGDVFDESGDEVVSFPLKYVIAGWQEGLQLMSEGAKYTFYVPSELAYGKDGAGEDVLPNAVLVFEVELNKVIKAEKKDEKAGVADAVKQAVETVTEKVSQ